MVKLYKFVSDFFYKHEKNLHYAFPFFIFCSVCFAGRTPSSIVIFSVCCLILSKLVKICLQKLYSVAYFGLSIVICIFPAFLIQNSIDKDYAYANTNSIFKLGCFVFCSIFISYILNVFIRYLNDRYIKNRIFKIVLYFICLVILILPITIPFCYVCNWLMNNLPLESDAILAFLQTTYTEASEYFFDSVNVRRLCCFVIVISILTPIYFNFLKISFIPITKKIFIYLMLCLIFCFIVCKNYRHNLMTEPFFYAFETLNQYDVFNQLTEKRKAYLKNNKLNKEDSFTGTYVVVIGESLSRSYMGCYDFELDTTPVQTMLKKNDNAIFFENCFSNHVHTVQVLSYALTEYNQYNYNQFNLENAVSLIDIARHQLGFNTIWISNQQKLGIHETPISSIASSTDYQIWTNPNGKNYDEVVLSELKKLKLNNKRNLIFIHLIGNHKSYNERYPKHFTKFSYKNWGVDNYLNSIYYNDFVLGKILDSVKKLPDFQLMIYLSDHGEDALRDLGHYSARFTWDMAKIPFWIYLSGNYISSHEEIFNILKSHSKVPFSNDLLFDCVLGLLGAFNSDFYVSTNDISSKTYQHSFNDIKTLYGKKSIREVYDEKY